MFYSQFILAKKGPLGTIWIAAHLERKLRKNQVADTDIGVSVDSILFPDVPIALRLSSHLLLGVVRIYSRKVNYLFDDCSDALLKVKQAFRSAAVDLPPEESKAPYHSITLPETFDLDDFELPENDAFQGNFVDHHISSREQITLQDTMEGVTYSTSKFGLDERFGDGDASGLDLDEELFLDKIGTAEHANESADPQASTMIPRKQDEFPESRNVNSEPRVDGDNNDYVDDVMDYAHAPCTPGLVEEPILSNDKEVSACDDHLESEYHVVESTIYENDRNKENPSVQAKLEHVSSLDQVEITLNPSAEFVDKIIEASDMEYLQNGDAEKDKNSSPTVDNSQQLSEGISEKDQDIGLEKSACEVSVLTDNSHKVSEGISAKDQDIGLERSACEISGLTSNSHQVSEGISAKNQENASEQEKSDLDTKNEDEYVPENPENGACDHEKAASTESLFLRPCNSNVERHDITAFGVQSDSAALATSGMEETVMLGEACCLTDNSEFTKENQIEEREPGKGAEAELPAPEKLLSVPQGHEDLQENMIIGIGESDAGSKIVSGKKRNFTESTLTEQSMNSVESSRLVRFKRTIDSVPDDDDMLSSILVGRSSVLKVKPTPRLSEVTSTKRTRSAPKRKIHMDDTMVLHGDTIRQQLTNTEDIRRVRKKAPCTRPEISMIKKQFLEDQIFSEPIYKDMSIELASLHNEICDLSGITVCKDDLGNSSRKIPFGNDEHALETTAELISPSHDVKNDDTLATAAEPHLTSQNAENNEPLDIENDKASIRPNDIEQNKERITNEVSLDRDNNEVAEPSENPVLVDNRTEELDQTNLDIDISKEQINVGEAYIPQQETLLEITEVETGPRNEDADEKTDMPSVEFGAAGMVVDNGQAISRDEFAGVRDDEGERDDAKQGELEYNEHILDSSYPSQVCLQEGIFGNNDELPEAYKRYMMDVESSGFDLHDQEGLNYSAAGNDTEFLNVDDDDDLTEMADDHIPDDDVEARFAENTGWSSRTRAVSKYLQTLFVKEAESGVGRKLSLSMENLLIGKSRKEASRMFFEALVLKTRDYIDVEQRNSFDEITIKPRSRLLKSEF